MRYNNDHIICILIETNIIMLFIHKVNIQQKLHRLRSTKSLLNGVLFSMYSFLNRGITFLLLLLLANYISPADYGYLSLFNTVLMVLGYFIALSADGYMGIVYFKEGKEGQKQVVSAVSFIILIISIVFLGILVVFGKWVSHAVNLRVEMLYVGVVISAATVFKNMYLDNIRLHEEVKLYGIISCSNAFLFFVLSLVLVIGFNLSWYGQIYANLLITVIYGGYALYYFVRGRYFTLNFKEIFKPMILWSIPLIPHAASAFIRQGCDRYIINSYHSIYDVGLFSFALNIINIVLIIGLGFNNSNSVDIYKTLGNKETSGVKKYAKLVKTIRLFSVLYLVSSIIVAVLSYIFVPLLLPQYTESKGYILILAIFGYLQCIYLLWTNYLFYYNKTKQIMFITFGSSVLHLLLSLWLTRYDLYYTAVIYCITQGIVAFAIKYLAKKEINNNLLLN